MLKDSYYFSHDSNARNDEKILMLRAEHGWEGYGIYWMLIEMMFETTETKLSHQKLKGIAFSNNIPITLLQEVINTAITENLFSSDDEYFWSESLRRRKNKFNENRKAKAEAGKRSAEKRWGKKKEESETVDNTNSDNTPITDPLTESNTPITESNKVKESKVKEKKEKEINSSSNEDEDDFIFKKAIEHVKQNFPTVTNVRGYAYKMIQDGWPHEEEKIEQKPKYTFRRIKEYLKYEEEGIATEKHMNIIKAWREAGCPSVS